MNLHTYTFFWLDGQREVLLGFTPQHAVKNAGYGGDALSVLGFWANGDNRDWDWTGSQWVRIQSTMVH
jgi:hypothetical protein